MACWVDCSSSVMRTLLSASLSCTAAMQFSANAYSVSVSVIVIVGLITSSCRSSWEGCCRVWKRLSSDAHALSTALVGSTLVSRIPFSFVSLKTWSNSNPRSIILTVAAPLFGRRGRERIWPFSSGSKDQRRWGRTFGLKITELKRTWRKKRLVCFSAVLEETRTEETWNKKLISTQL
jgi:hypothetical protein